MEQEENRWYSLKNEEMSSVSYSGIPAVNEETITGYSSVQENSHNICMSPVLNTYNPDCDQNVLDNTIPAENSPVSDDKEICEAVNKENPELNSMIGKAVLYYCKNCKISSLSLYQIELHVTQATCGIKDGPSEKQNHVNNYSADKMDHSYANELQHQNEVSAQSDTTLVKKKTMLLTYSRYRCELCPYVALYSETELNIHTECHKTSGFKALFTCCLCQLDKGRSRRGRPLSLTADWQKVRVHLARVHRFDFGVSCNVCSYMCKSHEQLDKHKHQHQLACAKCYFKSESQADLDVHVHCHITINTFHCFLCQDKLPGEADWNAVYDHLVASHPGIITPRHLCQKCGTGFQTLNKYEQHYRNCMLKLVCEECNEPVQITRLRQHINELHNKDSGIDNKNNPDLNAAKNCDIDYMQEDTDTTQQVSPLIEVASQTLKCYRHQISFSDKKEMEAHFKAEHSRSCLKKKKYSDFFTDQELAQPTENISEMAVLVSGNSADDVDDDADTVKSSAQMDDDPMRSEEKSLSGRLNRRKLQSEAQDKVRCKYCYKLFGDKWRLEAHCKRVHTEERMKKVPCTICGKLFRNQVQRRNHVRQVHEGIKRLQKRSNKVKEYFQCSLCQFSTPDKSRLRNHHLAVHQGIMPFACEYCNYKTKEKSDFRRHKLRHMGIKRHNCPYCPYQCFERWVMVNHCSRQHQVELPRISRKTRGGPFSMHHLRSAAVVTPKPELAHFVNSSSADATSNGRSEKREQISDVEITLSGDNYLPDKVNISEVSQPTTVAAEVRNAEVPTHDNVGITEVIVQTDDEGIVDNQIIFIEQPNGEDILQYVLLPCDMDDK